MATTLSYLDSYCERAGEAGLFAEPLNFVTNLFFILAAITATYLIARLPREPQQKRWDLIGLCLALFAIGIGSGLWHLVPSRATVLMDVIPITLFIQKYLNAAMRRILVFSWLKILAGWGSYLALSILAQVTLPPDTLNGTIMYIPTYATLIVLTLAVFRHSRPLGRIFTGVVMVWTLSLAFRTIDHEICNSLSIGTHFLWHTLNSWVLYRLLVVLIRHPQPLPANTQNQEIRE